MLQERLRFLPLQPRFQIPRNSPDVEIDTVRIDALPKRPYHALRMLAMRGIDIQALHHGSARPLVLLKRVLLGIEIGRCCVREGRRRGIEAGDGAGEVQRQCAVAGAGFEDLEGVGEVVGGAGWGGVDVQEGDD
jgi:hypothetical protein